MPTPAPPTPTPLPTWPDRWEPTGGPPGGQIQIVAIDPTDSNTLYAAGAGGAVYKSGDGGDSWAPSERVAPPNCPFSSLIVDAADPDRLYAVNDCAGVLKSSDAGATWSGADEGLEGSVVSLTGSPHAPGLLLAATDSGTVYLSRDGANSWGLVDQDLSGTAIRSLAISGPETFWAVTADENGGTLYRFSAESWSPVSFGPPAESRITDVFVDPDDPNMLYIGLESGAEAPALFRSTDGGANWTALNLEGAGTESSVYILGKGQNSDALYVTHGRELFASLDAGESWHRVELPPQMSGAGPLRQITIDPQGPEILYLPLPGSGLVKSEDGGATWRRINEGLSNTAVALIASHPADAATVYVASDHSADVFKSTDYGASWTRLESGGTVNSQAIALAVDPGQPEILYRVTADARILRSQDGGATWSVLWPDLRFSTISALATARSDPQILFANRRGFGLFRSDDGGETWAFLTTSGVTSTHALAMHPDDPGFVLSGSESSGRVHRSRDGGITWDVSLEVPEAKHVTSVAFDPRVEPYFRPGTRPSDPTRLYAASVGPRGVLWYSNDAGDAWQGLNDALNFTDVDLLTLVPHRPGAAYASVRDGGNWRTDDGGQSWHRLPGDPAIAAAAIAVDPSNQNVVYIADSTTPHLYRSIDDGKSWEQFFDAGPDYARLVALALAPSDPPVLYVSALKDGAGGSLLRIDATAPEGEQETDVTNDLPDTPVSLAVHPTDPRRVFALVPGSGLWKTLDAGVSWRPLTNGLPETSFYQVTADPNSPDTLFLVGGPDAPPETADADEKYGIWKSVDDGNTWTRVGGGTFGRASGAVKAIAFSPANPQVMYAAGEGGVYLSPDHGETWTNITGRLPFAPMNAVATDGQTLFAGSAGGGVFVGSVHPLIHTADWIPKSRLTVPIHWVQILLHPLDPQTLYVGAYPGGVFETEDGGQSWHARNRGLPSFAVVDPSHQGYYGLSVSTTDPEVLYLGLHDHGLYRSDDGGHTWRSAFGDQGELRAARVGALLISPENADLVYAATENGVWRTVDGGRNWQEFNAGLSTGNDVIRLALAADGRLYAGTAGYGLYARPVFTSTPETVWEPLPSPGADRHPRHVSLLVDPDDSDTLYAGVLPGGVFKTTGEDSPWQERNVGLNQAGVLVMVSHPDDGQILYAGTTDGIARSLDGGRTWHPRDAGWPPRQPVVSMALDPENPATLYACSAGTVMKSTDKGANWSELSTGLEAGLVFRQILVDRFDPGILYLATAQNGVYVSRDGGTSWSSWNEGLWNPVAGGADLHAPRVLRFSADGRLLYLGTAGSGVWRRPAAGLP